MNLWMLDTCVCVELLRNPPGELAGRVRMHPLESVGLSAISLAELLYGAARSRDPEGNRSAVERFLLPFRVWPFDPPAGQIYGPLRRDLDRIGRPIGSLDLLIAAHALSVGATLITGNEREFRRVPGLRVENWLH